MSDFDESKLVQAGKLLNQTGSTLTGEALYEVYYKLTVSAAVPNWSDTEDAIGRWYKSQIYIDHRRDCVKFADYSYPYALQSDGTWMMCGRVVKTWSNVILFQKDARS